jgi:hypothetical protein
MINGTYYRSQYMAGDQEWRSTGFDMRYILNAVAGYELWFGPVIALGLDLKTTYAGGRPYIPVNEELSIQRMDVVYDDERAYETRYPDYFRTDIRFYLKINYPKLYYELAFDLQNITNHENIYDQTFIPTSGRYNTYYQMGFFPMVTFKLLF